MKRLSITLLALFLASSSIFSQTSEEEYLYAALGYKEQLLKGLDDKEGYHWKPLREYNYADKKGSLMWKKKVRGKFMFEGLFRDGETHPCAVVAIYLVNANLDKKEGLFLCIPHPDSPQNVIGRAEQYLDEEADFNSDELYFYSLALGNLAVYLAQGTF